MSVLTPEERAMVHQLQAQTGVQDIGAAAQMIVVLKGMNQDVVNLLGGLGADVIRSLASQSGGQTAVNQLFNALAGPGQPHTHGASSSHWSRPPGGTSSSWQGKRNMPPTNPSENAPWVKKRR